MDGGVPVMELTHLDAESLRDAINHVERRWRWGAAEDDDVQTLMLRAARAHLETLPPTKRVSAWIVSYWSLTAERTVAQVTYSEERADRLVELNGDTAMKHECRVSVWTDRETALREGEAIDAPSKTSGT